MWWETSIVVAAVAGSILFLARGVVRSLRGRGGCGTACGKCPTARAPARPLVGDPLDFRRGLPPSSGSRS